MLKGIYVMLPEVFENVYNTQTRQEISKHVEIICGNLSSEELLEDLTILKDVDVIFSGWGAPVFDETLLKEAPNLKAIFYAAGTLKHIITDTFWKYDIKITTANVANAIPVAEYSLAGILFALKNVWKLAAQVRQDKTYQSGVFAPVVGNYQSTVGIVSLSQVGRMVIEHLKHFDVNVIGFDPYVSKEEFERLGVKSVSLEELFEVSDVVSLHSPLLSDTKGMIQKQHFQSMKKNSTFINTARGAIVDELAMIEVLEKRLDITALLDVTFPEPPEEDSPLYTMENVILTPHIAGSAGNEQVRLGAYMAEELKRFIKGESLKYEVNQYQFNRMA